jgi:hypothetical protein
MGFLQTLCNLFLVYSENHSQYRAPRYSEPNTHGRSSICLSEKHNVFFRACQDTPRKAVLAAFWNQYVHPR